MFRFEIGDNVSFLDESQNSHTGVIHSRSIIESTTGMSRNYLLADKDYKYWIEEDQAQEIK